MDDPRSDRFYRPLSITEQDAVLDRSRLLIGPAVRRYVESAGSPAQVAALRANGFLSDFPLHDVGGRPATTPMLVDLWLEHHPSPAAAVVRLRPLSPALFATMREHICSALSEAGLITAPRRSIKRTRQLAAVFASQDIPMEHIPWGTCFLLSSSPQGFRLLVMAPAPAPPGMKHTEPILFDRTAEDRIIVPATWIRAKFEALMLNDRAAPESRERAHALLDRPIGDTILPADVETVMAPIADASGTTRYEALPGGCVIVATTEQLGGST